MSVPWESFAVFRDANKSGAQPPEPQHSGQGDDVAAWLGTAENALSTLVWLSLSLLGIAACDFGAYSSVATAMTLSTAVYGVIGLATVLVLRGRSIPTNVSSLLLWGVWLALWLNTTARVGLLPNGAQVVLTVMVLAALGWCIHSREYFWTTIGLALPAGFYLTSSADAIFQHPEYTWSLPVGVFFGWRQLTFRLRAIGQWNQLNREHERSSATLYAMLASLKSNEERFRMLSETVPVGVFQTDERGTVIYTNTAWRRITGTTFRDSVISDWTTYLHIDERAAVREQWYATMLEGETFEHECRLQVDSQFQRWIHVRSCPIYADAGVTFVGMVEDITLRKQAAEDSLRHAAFLQESQQKEVQNTQRLAALVTELEASRRRAEEGTQAKSEFLASMSHEIRTPMTAVLGYADLLLEQTANQPGLQDPLQTIKRNGEYLLEIINDILDLSKIEAGKIEIEQVRCSPRQITKDALSLMQIRAQAKGLELAFETVGPFPQTVETDPTRLRQILLNLIGNSIKFTSAGRVTVRLRYVHTESTRPDAAGTIQLSVVDTGMGMTPAQLAKLFRPFTQADSSTTRQFGGTGLGLTICKRFAEMLGGDILVESQPGQGSTFDVIIPAHCATNLVTIVDPPLPSTLPRTAQAEPTNPVPVKSSAAVVAGSVLLPHRILVAEDGPDNQKLIQFILKKAGATVTVVENGQLAVDAIEAAVAEQTPFDLVLMDMSMPILDGYNATRVLRERGFTLPVIALTAHAMNSDRDKCLAAGCTDYATKPIDRAKLLATLARVLDPAGTSAT